MNTRKMTGVILLAATLMFVFSLSGFAQAVKNGYIDSDKIFLEYTEWNKAQEEFNTDYNAWEVQAKEMQTEFEEMLEEYNRQRLILSDEKKKEREAAIEAKKKALDAFTGQVFGPGGEAERRNNALIQPLLEKINAAIEQVATDGNYDFVFNSAGLAYAKKDYDITEKVLDILEE
ncbi:MAG: OmpH family outer membrane protein [candidate division Zixibacteria bacterium]|nr:OmpH family outer membrane protein [candidate division Zixibacteria bacterium]